MRRLRTGLIRRVPSLESRRKRWTQCMWFNYLYLFSWFSQPTSSPKSKLYTYNDLHNHSNLRNRTQDTVSGLKSLSSSLDAIAAEIKGECKVFENVQKACGLASLPDEVLAMIFDLMVIHYNYWEYWNLIPWNWQAAVMLSHVSRYFRDVMFACSRIWTIMNQRPQMGVSCPPRTKNDPWRLD